MINSPFLALNLYMKVKTCPFILITYNTGII